MIDHAKLSVGRTLASVRSQQPLVHCLTNPVAANLTANALICLGASPLMAEAELPACDALLVNIGMQTPARMVAARAAIGAARLAGRPWVLDPVAAGALSERTALARAMAAQAPSLIKGNASEILALADGKAAGRGTDTRHDAAEVLEPAQLLARRTGAVVAITGAVDWVTDGAGVVAIRRGHPLMARVSALGCVAGALAAACLAVEPDRLVATTHALTLLGIAGERAGVHAAGPGSFAVALLDALAALDPADGDLRDG